MIHILGYYFEPMRSSCTTYRRSNLENYYESRDSLTGESSFQQNHTLYALLVRSPEGDFNVRRLLGGITWGHCVRESQPFDAPFAAPLKYIAFVKPARR